MWPASTDPSCGVTVSAAAVASGGRLLRSWRQVMETLRHGTGSAGEGAELLAVAVDPSARGRGAGTLLVEGFLTEVGRRRQRRGPRRGRSGQRDRGRAVPANRIPHGRAVRAAFGNRVAPHAMAGPAGHESRDGGGPARRNGRSRRHGGVGPGVHRGRPSLGHHGPPWTAEDPGDPRAVPGRGRRLRRRGHRRMRSAGPSRWCRWPPLWRSESATTDSTFPRRCGSLPSWAWVQ